MFVRNKEFRVIWDIKHQFELAHYGGLLYWFSYCCQENWTSQVCAPVQRILYLFERKEEKATRISCTTGIWLQKYLAGRHFVKASFYFGTSLVLTLGSPCNLKQDATVFDLWPRLLAANAQIDNAACYWIGIWEIKLKPEIQIKMSKVQDEGVSTGELGGWKSFGLCNLIK